MISQSEKVQEQIEKLLNSGVRNKSELYSKLVVETGLPRSTIRRIARDFKKHLERKVVILTKGEILKEKEGVAYSFIPEAVRFFWQKKTQFDFNPLRCQICKRFVCYLNGDCEGSIICDDCQKKFPKEKRKK